MGVWERDENGGEGERLEEMSFGEGMDMRV